MWEFRLLLQKRQVRIMDGMICLKILCKEHNVQFQIQVK